MTLIFFHQLQLSNHYVWLFLRYLVFANSIDFLDLLRMFYSTGLLFDSFETWGEEFNLVFAVGSQNNSLPCCISSEKRHVMESISGIWVRRKPRFSRKKPWIRRKKGTGNSVWIKERMSVITCIPLGTRKRDYKKWIQSSKYESLQQNILILHTLSDIQISKKSSKSISG